MSLSQTMSPLAPDARPAHLRLALGVLLVVALSACGKKEEAAQPGPGAEPAATTQPAKAPPKAVSDEVAALSADDLRKKASQAYQDSRLYAPAGDNAMEYYLALRDKRSEEHTSELQSLMRNSYAVFGLKKKKNT